VIGHPDVRLLQADCVTGQWAIICDYKNESATATSYQLLIAAHYRKTCKNTIARRPPSTVQSTKSLPSHSPGLLNVDPG